MTQYVFSNNGITTLGSNLGSGATSMTVASGTGIDFPVPGSGQIVPLTLIAAGSTTGVPNEIVYATARSGDTLTIVRGQEGTTAQNWSSGDIVANMATADFYNQQASVAAIQKQAGNFADDTGAADGGIITLSPAPANLAALVGVPIRVLKMANANTAAYVLNVNGLGAEPVTVGGVVMESGQLHGSEIFEVIWNGSNFDLTSPPALVYNNNLAKMAMDTIKANLTGGAAAPQDVTLSSLATALGIGTLQSNSNGYYFYFGSILIQFKQLNINVESAVNIVFPEPFSAVAWFDPGLLQTNNSSNESNLALQSGVLTNTGFTGHVYAHGDSCTASLNWIAIGLG